MAIVRINYDWLLYFLNMHDEIWSKAMEQDKDKKTPSANNHIFDSMKHKAKDAANLFKCLGHPLRLRILCLLIEGEKTVGQISAHIGIKQPLTSQHLSYLRLSELVQSKKHRGFTYYSINDTITKDIIDIFHNHYCVLGKKTKDKDVK